MQINDFSGFLLSLRLTQPQAHRCNTLILYLYDVEVGGMADVLPDFRGKKGVRQCCVKCVCLSKSKTISITYLIRQR